MRDRTQISHVKNAVMRRAVRTDNASPINREYAAEPPFINRTIVNQLVVAALQKGGVNRCYRLQPLRGHARRHRHRMLLRDANIEKALREVLRKAQQPGSRAHRRRHRADTRVIRGQPDQLVPKHGGKISAILCFQPPVC